MATYGRGQMLGAGIDPRMFVQDYSGFARAGAIQGQGMAQLGADIAGGIKDFREAQKERKQLDAQIKANSASIETAMKLGDNLGIDLRGVLEPIYSKINDPNTTPAEALAFGQAASQQIANAFSLGIGAQQREFSQEKAIADSIQRQQKMALDERRTRAAELSAQQSAAPSYQMKKATITTPTGEVFEQSMPFNPKTGRFYDAGAGKEIQDINAWGLGEPAYAEDMPPTSQIDEVSAAIAQTAQMNIGRLSTAKTPGTQGGNLGCADAVCKIYKQATGEELVQGGTLSTSKMIESLNSDPRFQSVSVNEAKPGDIIVTPRGKKAGHAGIFVGENEIASNSSKGFKGNNRGTFTQNYSKDSWINSIDSRNPGKTQVFRRVEGDLAQQQIQNNDLTQQAMGSPEQQAEIARMIQDSQNMGVAQSVPGVSTEPSMAQPQIEQAPQAPQYQVRPGFVPVKPQTPLVTVNTAEGQQQQREKAVDKFLIDLKGQSAEAASQLPKIDEISKLLDEGVRTGFAQDVLMKGRRVFGMDVSNEEAFRAASGNIAMGFINLTKGAISDREMKYFTEVLAPNIGTTVEGNKKITAFLRSAAQKAADIEKVISEGMRSGKSPFEIDEQVQKIRYGKNIIPGEGASGVASSGLLDGTQSTELTEQELKLLEKY
jgi:hypothetical protein